MTKEKLYQRASDVLGTVEKAEIWMKRENRALGNIIPISLIDTEEGRKTIDNILGRIEHGLVS